MRFLAFSSRPAHFRIRLDGRTPTYGRVVKEPRPGWLDGSPGIGPAETVVECSAVDLMDAIARCHSRRDPGAYIPLLALPAGLLAYAVLIAVNAPAPLLFVTGIVGILVSIVLYISVRNLRGETTGLLVEYVLDREAAEMFERLQKSLRRLATSARIWHIPREFREGATNERLRARRYFRRYQIRPVLSMPPKIQCNVRVPVLYSEHRHLYFFPDRLLVMDDASPRAFPYGFLSFDTEHNLCVEDEDVPPDAQVVDTTWKHVLHDGSPDMRVRNNPRLPVALYGELRIWSSGGLDELFQCSEPDAALQFVSALELIAWESAGEDGEEVRSEEDPEPEAQGAETGLDDELYDEALRTVVAAGSASLTQLSEAFAIEPSRAAVLIALMERDGYISAMPGASGRVVNRSAIRFVALRFQNAAPKDEQSARNERRRAGPARDNATRPGRRGRRQIRDPYDVLDLDRSATPDEIASAYHRLAKLYHPDKVANLAPEFQELAELRMKDLNEAYRTLTQPTVR